MCDTEVSGDDRVSLIPSSRGRTQVGPERADSVGGSRTPAPSSQVCCWVSSPRLPLCGWCGGPSTLPPTAPLPYRRLGGVKVLTSWSSRSQKYIHPHPQCPKGEEHVVFGIAPPAASSFPAQHLIHCPPAAAQGLCAPRGGTRRVGWEWLPHSCLFLP